MCIYTGRLYEFDTVRVPCAKIDVEKPKFGFWSRDQNGGKN